MHTYGFFTRAKPYNMSWVWYVRSAAENRQNPSEALSSWLCHTEHIQIDMSWRPKIGGTGDIQVKIKRTTYHQISSDMSQSLR